MTKDTSSILSDAEVRQLVARLRDVLPAGLGATFDVESTVRFAAVAAQCRERREETGLTIKDAAARLRAPQYRIRAVESGHISEIRADLLNAYVSLLGLEGWFDRWKQANPALAKALQVVS